MNTIFKKLTKKNQRSSYTQNILYRKIRNKTERERERERERDQKNQTADITTDQNGTPVIDANPEIQYAIIAKRKLTLRTVADPNTKNNK